MNISERTDRLIFDGEDIQMVTVKTIHPFVNALFFEIHPNPDKALCDGPNMIALKDARKIFEHYQ